MGEDDVRKRHRGGSQTRKELRLAAGGDGLNFMEVKRMDESRSRIL
jgi:hypothetical protein